MRLEPMFEPLNLAFTETGCARHLPGELTIDHLELCCDQVIDTKELRNWLRNETIGCLDDDRKIILVTMRLDQLPSLGQHDGCNLFTDEGFPPLF